MEKIKKITKHKTFTGYISVILLGIVSFLAFVPILTYAYFAKDLQTKDGIMNRNNTGVILMDRNGEPFFKFNEARVSDYVPLNDIPENMRRAVIVAEDKDFYKHPGFSVRAIAGAFVADIKNRDLSYGGSTITQQLTKNSLLTTKRNFLRKYQEVILSSEIERRYSKDEILEMYLNSAYFGEGAFGVEDASQVYFNKKVSDLSLAEAALIAGILPAPTKYSPLNGGLEGAKERQRYVLTQMAEEKYITPVQRDEALRQELVFGKKVNLFSYKAPHFALFVKKELEEKYGEEQVARSGFKVKTTLDLKKQEYAEKVVADQVARLQGNNVSNGAAVVLDPNNGEIIAMVGSKDWNDEEFGKLNIITTPRQPGSSFKPIVYARALEDQVISPSTILKDQPTTFPEDGDYNSWSYKQGQNLYKPKNYDGKFRGPVTPRRALSNSLNVPAVEVMAKVGKNAAIDQAQRMGISTLTEPQNYGLSMVLGATEVKLLELTEAYSAFANGGLKYTPTSIIEINDKYDQKVYKHEPSGERVLSEEAAYIITSFLSDKVSRKEVFGNALDTATLTAVKTGTTENYKDALTMGYNNYFAVGVWVGNNYGEPMDSVAGSLGAAPIFRSIIDNFSQGLPPTKFNPPSGVVQMNICRPGKDATSSAIVSSEYFIRGTEPNKNCVVTPRPTPNPSGSPQPSPQTPPPTQTPTQPPQQTEIIITPPRGGPSNDNNGSGGGAEKKDEQKTEEPVIILPTASPSQEAEVAPEASPGN